MLTEEEVKKGYWGDKWSQPSPRPSTEVKEYQGGDTLSVSCTQLGNASYQKRIVAEWCEALPHLSAVKTLCFHTRVNQRLFDAAALMPQLEVLYVKWSGLKSVASLAGNARLRVLTLGSSPGIQDIKRLQSLPQLQVLEMENIPDAFDLGFLSGLGDLEALSITGGLWKTLPLASLEPLADLHKLKYLALNNTRIQSGGLEPLLHIKSLVTLHLSIIYTVEEFASLRAGLPMLTYGTPFNEDAIREYAVK